eukprot:7211271-Prymnesium_polylepis.1
MPPATPYLLANCSTLLRREAFCAGASNVRWRLVRGTPISCARFSSLILGISRKILSQRAFAVCARSEPRSVHTISACTSTDAASSSRMMAADIGSRRRWP